MRRRGSSADTSLMLPSPVERLGCGAVAGLLGQASSYPLDIVRWRLTEFIISISATWQQSHSLDGECKLVTNWVKETNTKLSLGH